MGLQITKSQFEEEDYRRFRERLTRSLSALERVLQQPCFGLGPASVGAELEMSIVDGKGQALFLNRDLLNSCVNDHFQLELDRFNLEYNSTPVPLAGRPFASLRREFTQVLEWLEERANALGGRMVTIGILPTLVLEELGSSAMSDLPRYHALSAGLRRLKQGPFMVQIDGLDPLQVNCPDVTLEGANTSFQLHLRVEPEAFVQTYNAAQLVTPVVLALSGNSPIFLGHRLWEETRVALFKQAIDSRKMDAHSWHPPARVSFGFGWVRKSVFELFAESVGLYPPLLPVLSGEDPLDCLAEGRLPKLEELRLHQGTVWRWNRAIYDANDGGHLRIEFRSLPSGPTPIDMMASGAFLIGLTLGLRSKIDALLPLFPFEYANRNFYRAAQFGLDTTLLWPASDMMGPREISVSVLAEELLPVAEEGLLQGGVDPGETSELFEVIRRRIQTRRTGARWQLQALRHFEQSLMRPAALARMLERYIAQSRSGIPVAEWDWNFSGNSR